MQQPYYLIPGTMCDKRLWHKLEEKLTDRTCFHCDYSAADTLKNMQDTVLKQAPNEACHLIGFSLGGYLAMKAAIMEPKRFTTLTVIAASPFGLSEEEKKLRQQSAITLKNFTYKGMSKTRLAQFVHPANLENRSVTNTILTMEKDLGQDVLIRQLMAPLDRPDISAKLKNLPFTVRFIIAEEDQFVAFKEVKTFAEKTASIQFHHMKDTGHMIPLEAPSKLATIVLNI